MNLDDLLGDIDGIGGDSFTHTPAARAGTAGTAAPVPSQPAALAGAMPPEAPVHHSVDPEHTPPLPPMLNLVLDVEFDVMIELGTGCVPLKTLLNVQPGDRFPLDRRPDEPLDLYVHDQCIARGEALIVDGALAIRITELLPNTDLPLSG